LDHAVNNAEMLDWSLARGMLEEFLPRSAWAEEVVAVERGEPGRLEVRGDARRRYWFHGCPVRVRRAVDGRELDRRYSLVFDWRDGRWQMVDLPAVCM
jgi:hypothetical protein